MFKFIIELCPLVAFFVGYGNGGIQKGTLYTVVASIASLSIYFIVYRKVEKVALISSLILITSASITLATGNPMFIKMKPTILYLISASVLYAYVRRDQSLIKSMLKGSIVLKDDKLWNNLSYRFIAFFLALAVINEIVWRNCEETTWVNFKVFGMGPILIVFILLQVPFLLKNKQE